MADEDNDHRDENPGECDACHFETPALTRYDPDRMDLHLNPQAKAHWLCALCAGTVSGNTLRHPRSYGEQAETLRTICYVGNAIIKALEPVREPAAMQRLMDLGALASAMRKLLPAPLLAEVVAHLDPLTPFVEFLRTHPMPDDAAPKE